MPGVRIVVDSTADLPHNLAEELDITVVPVNVHFGGEVFADWSELTPLEFYDLLRTSPYHPYTSPPSPERFAEVYRSLTADGSAVLSLHFSNALGPTYDNAVKGAAMVEGGRIELVDTRLVSVALGMTAVEAAVMAREGKGLAEIKRQAEETAARTRVFFTVDTLDYLARNGRIGRAQALLGSILAVKPVLTLEDGVITPFEKVRGDKRVVPRMVEIMRDILGTGPVTRWAVVHADCLDRALELARALEEECGLRDGMICDLGAVVGTHAGPGTLAVAACQS